MPLNFSRAVWLGLDCYMREKWVSRLLKQLFHVSFVIMWLVPKLMHNWEQFLNSYICSTVFSGLILRILSANSSSGSKIKDHYCPTSKYWEAVILNYSSPSWGCQALSSLALPQIDTLFQEIAAHLSMASSCQTVYQMLQGMWSVSKKLIRSP